LYNNYIYKNLKTNDMLELNQEQLQVLQAMIEEIPTKYGVPMLNFLSKILTEQQQAQQAEEEKTSKK